MSDCDHVFRHKDDYCIRCERRIFGAVERRRAPKPTDLDAEREFVETPVIDTSGTQDDYYDSPGMYRDEASSLTERALRDVMRR